jgi:hypothetical protein
MDGAAAAGTAATAAVPAGSPQAAPRRRADAYPLAAMRRDLRALSADLTRLALGGEEEELPPSPAESGDEDAYATSGTSDSEATGRGRGAPEPDDGAAASSSDESRLGQGLKARACTLAAAKRIPASAARADRGRLPAR